MSRAEMEAAVQRRVAELAPAADEKTRWYAVFMIMAYADSYAQARAEAALAEAGGG